ncbi:hypothetical protein TraAM80_06781 [Trypanosoma rangeli]|uniref:Uncharacterized protein n=1 Tax=Trypanosoma rangeli TaxID=5698 RepID=A0A3R7KUS2_TRYRA|nr:uncharacterized protein TraAM80_06781 [Trypanosoma rangeli]RNF01781.1 hypothetical protein TraAM80_06781 [Trypanosoma rangeli]|eukprot:RNF01781.1 hypothetical protein TraAM80_06781 [Trypanosoma rangeli]
MLSKVMSSFDEAKKEIDTLRNTVRGLEEKNGDLRVKSEEMKDAYTVSEAGYREERRSLLGELSVLRSRCLALEQELGSAKELSREKAVKANSLLQQLAEARSGVANVVYSHGAKLMRISVGLEESVLCLRDVVVAELKRAARGTVVVDEEGQCVVQLARELCSVIDHTADLSLRLTQRQRQLTQLLNQVAAKQGVALRKIQQCLLGSVALRKADAAILEACLLLFNDVEGALSAAVDTVAEDVARPASVSPVQGEREALLQHALRRAQNRVCDTTSSSEGHTLRPGWGTAATPVKDRGASPGVMPCSERRPPAPVSRGHASMASTTRGSPHTSSRVPLERQSKFDVGHGGEDPFGCAVATLSAQEKQYARRQHSMPLKRWVAPGKAGATTRGGM